MFETQPTDAPPILVLDGHDGTGKTTLAHLVANSLGGTYVKPFDGTLGDMLIWLCHEKKFALANSLAQASVEKIKSEHTGSDLLVFDRHWLSIFTLVPEELRASWLPLPETILCWADLQTSISRFSSRGDDLGDIAQHKYYIELYRSLADEFSIPLVDTGIDTTEGSLDKILTIFGKSEP